LAILLLSPRGAQQGSRKGEESNGYIITDPKKRKKSFTGKGK
jgi:hypothetical protein